MAISASAAARSVARITSACPAAASRSSSSWPPGDSDQRCSTEELLDAWMGIMRGYKHVNRILACHVEQETGLPAPDFFVLAKLRRSSDPAVPLSTLARELAFS